MEQTAVDQGGRRRPARALGRDSQGTASESSSWRAQEAGWDPRLVIVPDMRGFGDSDKPPGSNGYDAHALAEECRALLAETGFGRGRPLIVAAHDMGAPPAPLWAADHPDEIAGLLYVEAPVMLGEVRRPDALSAAHEEPPSQAVAW